MRAIIRPIVSLALWAAACGPTDLVGEGEVPEDFEFRTPKLETVAPGEIALGDQLSVFGGDFLDPAYGSVLLRLDGTYTDEHGERHAYQGELPLAFKNASVAELDFDRLYFSPSGDRIGVFEGSAQVVNRLEVMDDPEGLGAERASESVGVTLWVLPSIDVTEMRSVDDGRCQGVTKATIGNTNLGLSVRSLGLGSATPTDPITFKVHFLSPQVQVRYIKKDVYNSWPLDIPLDDSVVAQAPPGQNTMTFTVTQGSSLALDPTWRQTVVRVSPPVTIGQDQFSEVLLQRLATGPTDGPGPAYANFLIEATHRNGQSARRVVSLEVHNAWEIATYNGNQRLVERYQAEVPSGQCGGCVPGGDIGRELTYTEGESVSRTRSVSIRWDLNVANSLGLQVGTGFASPVQVAANAQTSWSETFGMDVTEAVSTESHRGLNLSAHVLPTYYGLCYRQLSRYERTVEVIYHSACGQSGVVGDAVLTDWGWGFDVATGPECPPATNLPPAESFE